MDHTRTGGTLLNQKFTPQLLKDDDGLNKLVKLSGEYRDEADSDEKLARFNLKDDQAFRVLAYEKADGNSGRLVKGSILISIISDFVGTEPPG